MIMCNATHPKTVWNRVYTNNLSCIGQFGPGCPQKAYETDAMFQNIPGGLPAIVDEIKHKVSIFRRLVDEGGELADIDPLFLFQTCHDDPRCCIDGLHCYDTFCYVMLSYLRYLHRYLGAALPGDTLAKEIAAFEKSNKTYGAAVEEIQSIWTNTGRIEREQVNQCCAEMWKLCRSEIAALQSLADRLIS